MTEQDVEGDSSKKLNRTLGFAHLGGATLDNEDNHLIKKLFTAMGAVSIENQARIPDRADIQPHRPAAPLRRRASATA